MTSKVSRKTAETEISVELSINEQFKKQEISIATGRKVIYGKVIWLEAKGGL